MILPFSTQLNGKPTYFVEKIIIGLVNNELCSLDYASEVLNRPMTEIRRLSQVAKLHTIRADKNDRWYEGVTIDFYINNRQPNMFRFAPRITCSSTQDIFMTNYEGRFQITVDDDTQMYYPDIEKLAINDGFDSYDDFREYFISQMVDEVFSGKIIHWTNLRY